MLGKIPPASLSIISALVDPEKTQYNLQNYQVCYQMSRALGLNAISFAMGLAWP